MNALLTQPQAEELLYREALLLDTRAFDSWLMLFTPDVEFWMPAWRDEITPTADPDTELSLIYYKGIRNLQDRVERLTSGLSTASTPPPRCSHSITNVLLLQCDAEAAQVSAVFTCHRFEPRMNRQLCFFGRYEYDLRAVADGWKIARKKIILLNDTIPTMVDIDSI
jgi:benzoate/toluate 1,2-dioxygenase subunit beta